MKRLAIENDVDTTLIPASLIVLGFAFSAGLLLGVLVIDFDGAARVIEARENVRAQCLAGNVNACRLYEVDYK